MANIEEYGLEAKLACQNTEEYKLAKEALLKSTCLKESLGKEPGDAWLMTGSFTDEEMYNFFTCSAFPPVGKQVIKVDAECPENYLRTALNTIDGHEVSTCLGLEYPTTGEYLGTYSCAFDTEWFCQPESSNCVII